MSDRVISWLRTIVPGLWSAAIAYAVSLGLPDSVTAAVNGLGQTVLIPIVLALVYAFLRKVEAKLPPWATRLLLGSNQPPSYAPTGSDGVPDISTLQPSPTDPTEG
jgi:hypothetical protein